jgi:ferritin-like metal-binding protein YciE
MIVPYFGALASSIVPILYALTFSPGKAVLVAIVYILAHQLESNVIQPVVVARTVEMHPAVIAIGVIAVEQLFGFVGLIVAVPILATVRILIEELWIAPLEENRREALVEQRARFECRSAQVRRSRLATSSALRSARSWSRVSSSLASPLRSSLLPSRLRPASPVRSPAVFFARPVSSSMRLTSPPWVRGSEFRYPPDAAFTRVWIGHLRVMTRHPQTLEEQLNKYLTDVHSIEQQALAQMKAASELAEDPVIASAFARHLGETEEHEQLIRQRLEARGCKPATVKDVVGTLTGKGFAALAAAQPDTPGKLVAHALSYEHMEEAAYGLLALLAERVADVETLELARRIEQQERAMADRLEGLFDEAVKASLRALDPHDLEEQIDKYLADAHAIEEQAIQLLRRAPKLAGDAELAAAFDEHLDETEGHRQMLEARLEARAAKPSKLKDAALRLGALNWGAFFAAQPDTPAKLCAFAYAFEHLEIASYELLRRLADHARDRQTSQLAGQILAEERAAAEKLWALLGQALDASLHEQRLPTR